MHRLTTTTAAAALHTGQILGLCATAVMAMALAPIPVAGPDEPDSATRFQPPPLTAVATPPGPLTIPVRFDHPVHGHSVSSTFGPRRLFDRDSRHEGVDIAAPSGTAVRTAAPGRVLRTGYDPVGFGRFVEVAHPNGMTTLYAHLSRIDVSTGQSVTGATRIGLVGSTGRSTGPHLHFEVRRGERPIDPFRVLGRTFKGRLTPA